jgi:outer membrane cobalamin receptor
MQRNESKETPHSPFRTHISIMAVLVICSPVLLAQPDTQEADPLITDGDPVGEELLDLGDSIDLLFEDFDIVISASRSAQTSNLAPVPVSILSSDDIHYSGVGELPELFAFVPGFDALQLDKNRWSLGVRGLHQTFSDRTLFLMNGRNVSSPVHGGVDL